MQTNLNLQNKVAIVTGAARGIGMGIAKKLAKHGARVVSVDIIEGFEESYLKEIGKIAPNPGFALKVDISCLEEVKHMVATVINKLNRINILVNAAGILCEELAIDLDEKDWDRLMSINAKGVFMCCKYVAKEMIKNKSGKIINISSQQAVHGVKENSAYAASKAAVLRFTQVLAIELAPYGIQVNSVCPGITMTDMIKQSNRKFALKMGIDESALMKKITENIPVGRLATPEDIAGLVGYLASSESDYVSGAAILITGGLTCN